jgi:hypothetical protein
MDSWGEDILEYPFTVTPAKAGVQRDLKNGIQTIGRSF